MDAILICIFKNKQCLELFDLLLESIALYNPVLENIEILIYTAEVYKQCILNSSVYQNLSDNLKSKIVFEIREDYETIDSAAKARLDLFELPSADKYSRFLYLDLDIIIKGSLKYVFELATDNVLYAVKEEHMMGSIYHGKYLFELSDLDYKTHSSFSSGILLFRNCPEIKELFSEINKLIKETNKQLACCDQPFICFVAFKLKRYDNEIMNSVCINNGYNSYDNNIIHHFPGGVGIFGKKIPKMKKMLKELKTRLPSIVHCIFSPNFGKDFGWEIFVERPYVDKFLLINPKINVNPLIENIPKDVVMIKSERDIEYELSCLSPESIIILSGSGETVNPKLFMSPIADDIVIGINGQSTKILTYLKYKSQNQSLEYIWSASPPDRSIDLEYDTELKRIFQGISTYNT